MFFLVRSAICIGIVACMLPGAGIQPGLHDLAASAGTAASAEIRSYCQGSTECLWRGVKLATALSGQTGPVGLRGFQAVAAGIAAPAATATRPKVAKPLPRG